MIRVFAEHARRAAHVHRPDGTERSDVTQATGCCADVHDGRGHVTHRFSDGPPSTAVPLPGVPVAASVTAAVRALPGRELYEPDDATAKTLRELAQDGGVELTLGAYHQHVAAGTDAAVVTDERLVCTVEASARTPQGVPCSEVVPWAAFGDPAESAARVAAAIDALHARRRLPWREDVPGGCDLVLLPGRAGAFFHELVGHPMEADVFASGTSFLAGRAGRRVAPEWLHVVDGGEPVGHGWRAGVDDEGTPRRPAVLIDRGRVGEPLTDLATALLRGADPTGHGRRLDHRHPAIARMTHTEAGVAPGTAPSPPPGDWIAPFDLQLQTMNLATGSFVFRSHTPLHHTADGTVHRLPPLDLYGEGPRVLAGLEPAGTESAGYGRATKGCGKLGQFPLVVTFANAGIRLPAGLVTLREARDG